MATDFLLAAVAGILAVLLFSADRNGPPDPVVWGAAFAVTALAAMVGGVFHGFRPRLTPVERRRLWGTTLLLSALASFLLLLGAGVGSEREAGRLAILVIAPVKLCVTLLYLRRTGNFSVVSYDAGMSLLLILALTGVELAAGTIGTRGWWIVAGVITALAGALVQRLRWRLTHHFDHNDLFHVAQMAACYLLYRGA